MATLAPRLGAEGPAPVANDSQIDGLFALLDDEGRGMIDAETLAEFMEVSLLQAWQLIMEIKKSGERATNINTADVQTKGDDRGEFFSGDSDGPHVASSNFLTKEDFRRAINAEKVDYVTFRARLSEKQKSRYASTFKSMADAGGHLSADSLANLLGCPLEDVLDMIADVRMVTFDESQEPVNEDGAETMGGDHTFHGKGAQSATRSLTFDDFVAIMRHTENSALRALQQILDAAGDILDLGLGDTRDGYGQEEDGTDHPAFLSRRKSSLFSIISEGGNGSGEIPDLVVQLWMRCDPDDNGDASIEAVVAMLHAAISRGDIEITNEEKMGLVFSLEECAQDGGKIRFKHFLQQLSEFRNDGESMGDEDERRGVVNTGNGSSANALGEQSTARSTRGHVRQLSVSSQVVERVASIKTVRARHFRNSEIAWQAPSKTLSKEVYKKYKDLFDSRAVVESFRGEHEVNFHSAPKMRVEDLHSTLVECVSLEVISPDQQEFCWGLLQEINLTGTHELDFEQFVVLMQEAGAKQRQAHSGWQANDSLELIKSKMSRKAKLVVQSEPGLVVEGDNESQATDMPVEMAGAVDPGQLSRVGGGVEGEHGVTSTANGSKSTREGGLILCGISAGMRERNCSVM